MAEERVDLVPMKTPSDPFDDILNAGALSASFVNRWMQLSYRLYGAMLDSDHSFFLSTSQFISQLSFLLSVCPDKTIGLRREFGWNASAGEVSNHMQYKALLDSTVKFIKKWREETTDYTLPGKITTSRRVVCHPKSIVLFHLDTLTAFRSHKVEMKLFVGAKELRVWADDNMMGAFKDREVFNGWDEEKKDLSRGTSDRKAKPGKNDEEREFVRKAPLLVWVGSAMVALMPEIFDAQRLYLHQAKYYYRITPLKTATTFPNIEGRMPWNTIILPTMHPNLHMVFIYDFSRTLCSFDQIRDHIGLHVEKSPCIVRRVGSADIEKSSIYYPHWNEDDFGPSRVAEFLREVADVEEIFGKGGYGDLANDAAVPQFGGDRDVSHFQQFSYLNFYNTPKTEDTEEHSSVPTNLSTEIVTFPFCAILWDYHRHLPIYMGKITGKKVARIVKKPKRRGGLLDWMNEWLKT